MALPSTAARTVCILLWNTCNARCAHCGPSSSPKDRTRNNLSLVKRLITEACDLYGPGWTLSLSGGEPFLYKDELLEIVQDAHQHKGYTALVTNAYWANSIKKAEDVLRPFIIAGLKIMSISADVFHDPFIPFRRVVNAIVAGQNLGLKVTVRVVGSKSSHASQIMNRLREYSVSYVEVMEMPLVPEGRAQGIKDEEYLRKKDFPKGRCPSPTMTIDAKSNVMVCCNGGGSKSALQIGNANDFSLLELEYKFSGDPVLNFLRKNGPWQAIKFLSQVDRRNILDGFYVNECDLCMRIFSERRGNDLRLAIEEDFMEKMQSAITTIQEKASVQLSTPESMRICGVSSRSP